MECSGEIMVFKKGTKNLKTWEFCLLEMGSPARSLSTFLKEDQ